MPVLNSNSKACFLIKPHASPPNTSSCPACRPLCSLLLRMQRQRQRQLQLQLNWLLKWPPRDWSSLQLPHLHQLQRPPCSKTSSHILRRFVSVSFLGENARNAEQIEMKRERERGREMVAGGRGKFLPVTPGHIWSASVATVARKCCSCQTNSCKFSFLRCSAPLCFP